MKKHFIIVLTFGLGLATPAMACPFLAQQTLPTELEALFDLEQHELMKSKIDAVVWGTFSTYQPSSETLQFHVGETLKGKVEGKINIETNRRDLILGTEVYYLNLRKTGDRHWTDIDVPQDTLIWGRESCELDASTTRCALYMMRLEEIKTLCISAIKEKYSSCVYPAKLPNACGQFRNRAR